MTKRKFPWKEGSLHQLKTHISLREVINGVDGTIYESYVHDHTKLLLQSGAKDFYAKPYTRNEENCPDEMEVSATPQKMITSYFSKIHSKTKPEKKAVFKHLQGEVISCEHIDEKCLCSFCNKLICFLCKRDCSFCKLEFCSNCSVIRYDCSNDMAICLSCAR